MEVTLRYKNTGSEFVERLVGSVLLQKELDTMRWLIGGFYFKTKRSPAAFLFDLADAGFEFTDFESIEFSPNK